MTIAILILFWNDKTNFHFNYLWLYANVLNIINQRKEFIDWNCDNLLNFQRIFPSYTFYYSNFKWDCWKIFLYFGIIYLFLNEKKKKPGLSPLHFYFHNVTVFMKIPRRTKMEKGKGVIIKYLLQYWSLIKTMGTEWQNGDNALSYYVFYVT